MIFFFLESRMYVYFVLKEKKKDLSLWCFSREDNSMREKFDVLFEKSKNRDLIVML